MDSERKHFCVECKLMVKEKFNIFFEVNFKKYVLLDFA